MLNSTPSLTFEDGSYRDDSFPEVLSGADNKHFDARAEYRCSKDTSSATATNSHTVVAAQSDALHSARGSSIEDTCTGGSWQYGYQCNQGTCNACLVPPLSPRMSSVILRSVQPDGRIRLEELPSIRHTNLQTIRINGRLVLKELRATYEHDVEGSWQFYQTCHAYPTCQSIRRPRVELDTLVPPETDFQQPEVDLDFSWTSSEIFTEKLTPGQSGVKGHVRRGCSGDMSDGTCGGAERMQAAMTPTGDSVLRKRTFHRSQSLPSLRFCENMLGRNMLGSPYLETSPQKLKFATDMETFVQDAAKTIEAFRPKRTDSARIPSLTESRAGVGEAEVVEPDAGWTTEVFWGCRGADFFFQPRSLKSSQ